jgi:hypothetical protein
MRCIIYLGIQYVLSDNMKNGKDECMAVAINEEFLLFTV